MYSPCVYPLAVLEPSFFIFGPPTLRSLTPSTLSPSSRPLAHPSAHSYYLSYHSASQVLWGYAIGVAFGSKYYLLVEHAPRRYPQSLLGRLRAGLLASAPAAWFRLRDGWAVWGDAGTEAQ